MLSVEARNELLEGQQIGFPQSPRVDQELQRREHLWAELNRLTSPLAAEPSELRSLGIYGGASGIWVDKARTGEVADSGVAVALLHRGGHYPDDLSDASLLYHYPATDRPPARDLAEIEATKECGRLRMPLFVVLPSPEGASLREVRLGWVEGWDDESTQFLVSFDPDRAGELIDDDPDQEDEFSAIVERTDRAAPGRVRPNQPRFRLRVFKRYGPCCAICDVEAPDLLKAAHLVPVKVGGTDDPRNGLVLCGNHHDALDKELIGIEPQSLRIEMLGDYSASELGVVKSDLHHLRAKPHLEALKWLWSE